MSDIENSSAPDDRPELPVGDLVDAGGAPLSALAEERMLLGIMLVDDTAVERVLPEVGEGDFFDPLHRCIFKFFARGYEEGWKVNTPAIVEFIGGNPDTVVVAGLTISQYLARLMVEADTSIDPVDIATYIQEISERRAIGTIDDREFAANTPFVSKMGLKMWADQNEPGPEYEYLVEDLIPEKEGVLVMGESQTGKSFLTFHLAMCGVRGVPFFGRRIINPFGVVWCAYEAARGSTARMRAYRKFHGLDVEDLPFAVLTKPLALWPDPAAVTALANEIKGIERSHFKGVPLGLIVFDTYNAATPGASEIDSETVSKIRLNFDRLREETGAGSIIVGHTNSVGKHRGNEQLYNNIETVLTVRRKTKVDNRVITELHDDDGRVIRTMKVKKQREGQDGEEIDFVLHEVEDGTKNKFGKARTSCVVTTPNVAAPMDDGDPKKGAPDARGVRASVQEKLFIQCLLQCLDDFGVPPPPELGLPRSVHKVVDYDHVKRAIAQKMLREEDDTDDGRKRHRDRVKKAVTRSREKLTYLEVICCQSPYIWWTGKPVQGIRATQPKSKDLFENEPPLPADVTDFF